MISLNPFITQLRRRLGPALPDLLARAADRWVIDPGGPWPVPAAIALPGQADRIARTEFTPLDNVLRSFAGGFDAEEGPTMGYRLRDVDLVDGVIYAGGTSRQLHARGRRHLWYRRPKTLAPAALYESWLGNQWFGNWLNDDCLAYPLAKGAGRPVTTAPQPAGGHVADYEARLGMQPDRITDAHFDELVLFDDLPNTEDKQRRAGALRDRLLAGVAPRRHPGVYLLRGRSGELRLLENERDLADRLARDRGFQVLDPVTASVAEILAACGNADVVAGVEGSHLVHGIVSMRPGAALLVIQPPDRVVAALKTMADRNGLRFAYVVAEGAGGKFRLPWQELALTLDLLA